MMHILMISSSPRDLSVGRFACTVETETMGSVGVDNRTPGREVHHHYHHHHRPLDYTPSFVSFTSSTVDRVIKHHSPILEPS